MTFTASRFSRPEGRGRSSVIGLTVLALAVATGIADQPDPRVGVEVVLRSWGTPLRVGAEVSQGRLPHRVFRVERTEGAWLWIVAPNFHGWVKEDEVVPLDQALSYFDAEIRAQPDDFGNYLRRGHLLARKGDLAKAQSDFDEAIRLAPWYPVCFHDRGLYWYNKRDFDKALADCDESIRLDPTYANAYDLRARVRLALKDHVGALADCDELIRLGPGVAPNFLLRAVVRYESRDLDRALPDANAAIRLDSTNGFAFQVRGAIRLKKGDVDLAILDCDTALLIDPRDENSRRNREIARKIKDQTSR
jgi:tetratricopeptide (TPR) repeat protein